MLRRVLPVVALLPLLSGCVAVAAAGVVGGVVGVVQYKRNEVSQDFGNDLEVTWGATLEAFERLELVPSERTLDATAGHLANEDLHVYVERHAEGFTRVRVRIGTFHTKDHVRRAELLLAEITDAIEGRDELRAWTEKTNASTPPDAAAAPQKP